MRTRTERPLGADDLLLASENPGAFFDVTATAGRLTMEEQLSRGPMDLPFLMLVVLLTGIGVIMMFGPSGL